MNLQQDNKKLKVLLSYLKESGKQTDFVVHVAAYVFKQKDLVYYVLSEKEFNNIVLPADSVVNFYNTFYIVEFNTMECESSSEDVDISDYIAVYIGEKLKNFISLSLNMSYKERNVVNEILGYIDSKISDMIFALCGLRGTGKTVAMLQTIARLNDFENTVYITVLKQGLDFTLLKRKLQEYSSKKYIFIDEVTFITNFTKDSAYLADILCNLKTRVIVSGTDSLVFPIVECEALFHRIIRYNLTYISYNEANRLVSQTLEQYLNTGGMFESTRLRSIVDVSKYVDTAILNNIVNTLQRNTTNKWENLKNLSEIELRTVIFKLMYAVVFSSFDRSVKNSINLVRYINQYDFNMNFEVIQNTVLNNLGLKSNFITSEDVLKDIVSVLTEIGVLVSVSNFCKLEDTKYYFTNPAITMQLSISIVKNLDNLTNVNRNDRWNMKAVYGLVFESVVMLHFLKSTEGYNVYFFRYENRIEVDIVLEKDSFDGNQCNLFEVKLTDDIDTAVVKTKWLRHPDLDVYFEKDSCNLCGRYIVYNGETCVFSGFVSPEVLDTKTETASDIEQRNKGVDLINVLELFNKLEDGSICNLF